MTAPENDPPLIVLLGPTASGKTSLALDLADALHGGGELIGADSMQIYRGMDVGTAKPTSAERARVPHHLIDFVDPHHDRFTAHDWVTHANQTIEDIRSRGKRPIVVGGTNLYVRGLLEGLLDGAKPDPEVRARLEARDDQALRTALETVDPKAAERIHRNDRRRTIRALEVFELTGTPLSSQQVQWDDRVISPRSASRVVCLDWPTDILNRRINARVRAMASTGFLEEVRVLGEKGPLSPQAAKAVGYEELAAHLAGEVTLEDALERTKIRTRRFAKQQRTWMRRFHAVEGTLRLDPTEHEPEEMTRTVLEWLGNQSEMSDKKKPGS
jgi:tRNA dimethylallyltransferase